MTKVRFSNPPSFATRSILALPVKWGTLNLPPLIASTSGRVDQIRCLTPASLAARMAAVAYLISLVPASRKLVTRKTPCAPSNAALSVSGLSKSASTTSSASSRFLSGLRVSARTLNCPRACRAFRTPPPCCPVAPITAISFLLLDNTLVLLSSSIIQDLANSAPSAPDLAADHQLGGSGDLPGLARCKPSGGTRIQRPGKHIAERLGRPAAKALDVAGHNVERPRRQAPLAADDDV